MTSRQMGRRMGIVAARRRTAAKRARPGGAADSLRERRRLAQFLACGFIFVLLVAAKLLLPKQMAQLNTALSAAMTRNMDVQDVFSTVGRAFSNDSQGVLGEVYQAVFGREEEDQAVPTAAGAALSQDTALTHLRAFGDRTAPSDGWLRLGAGAADPERSPEADNQAEQTPEEAEQTGTSQLSYVLYSDQNLPDNVSMDQSVLGFDYCTPVLGALTSGFGYREHPVEGEEKFHYGLDIGASAGDPVGCFADGTVTVAGESSSYGKYVMVSHPGGFVSLYAHCSRITAVSGTAVKEGQKIAEVGETGIATGPHLHFELHQGDQYLNPIYYVAFA